MVIMGKFQYFAVFVALATCHNFLPSHAWQGNKGNEPAFPAKQTYRVAEKSPQPLKASVSNVPAPTSEKKEDSTVTPKNGVGSFGYSVAAYTNAFRPTTPGNSPGVGHRKFAPEDKDMKAKEVVHSPNVKYVTEGTTNGFKPTNPGHSPGVGHSQQN
ncbi:unnamed protein product [Sphenostylis stenocarpa]|uniref:Uncharacterized protein n=1 Tax=Sphenostylis stenocarpa TaxID=92480 RepID=A0AA86SXX8_9FABA|nr:unnamed protein product [Sphenostylis stenocarpa]